MSTHFTKNPATRLLLLAALPLTNVFLYTWLAATTVVSRDQWRFLPILQDWSAGQFHWSSLWISHSQHRTPVYKLEFLLNALILKLDMHFEVMLGAALLAVSALLLVRRFVESMLNGIMAGQKTLAAVAAAWLVLSLNQWDNLIYGLGAVNGFGHLLFFTLFWLWLDTSLRGGITLRATAALTLLLAFILLCWAAGHGPAFLASVAAVLVVTCYRDHVANPASVWRLYAALTAAALLSELLYWGIGPLAPLRGPGAGHVAQMLAAPGRVLEFLLMALSGSVLPVAGMEHHGWSRGLSLLLGAGVATTYIFAVSAFIRRRLWSMTYVPAFLMAYSLLEIASVLVVRFNEGAAAAAAPRYVLDNALGLLGCFWTLILWHADRPQAKTGVWRFTLPMVSAAALLAAMAASIMLWGHVGEQRRDMQAAAEQVRAGDFQAQDWLCPDEALCRSGADYMKQQRLNVFRDQPDQPNTP